jgi:hypothetical protein
MFRRTDRQLALMGPESGLPAGAQQRLKASWAQGFREKVMPELLASEESFSILYGDEGRPNWSVARMLGVSLLQQLQDMSDQQALDALSFDVRWQHALDVTAEDAYLSRRSLVEFRRRLVQHDPDGSLLRAVFDRICSAGVRDLGLSTSEQRLDSTLVAANVRALGRMSLARETLRVFVRSLGDEPRGRLPEAVVAWHASLSPDGWEREVDKSDRAARLRELGSLVELTLEAFSSDAVVCEGQEYALLRRLADEHAAALGLSDSGCDTSEDDDSMGSDDEPPAAAGAEKTSKRRRKTGRKKPHSARYWSPHDPDASFGHKGFGYHVHVAETCRNVGTELLTDYAVVTAAQTDVGQALPSLQRLAERDRSPEVMYADGGYPTPADLVSAKRMGTELCAPVNRGKLSADSMSRADFKLDRSTLVVLQCPAGAAPTRHGERESSDSMQPRRSLFAFFATETCNPCPMRARCPVRQPNNARSREYRLELSEEMLARDARWTEQRDEAWKGRYRIRSGVEATMSELKRAQGMGRLRMRHHARVQVQVAFKTTACNIKRWIRACAAALRALWAALRALWPRILPRLPPLVREFRAA